MDFPENIVIPMLRKIPHIVSAHLFGSHAQNRAKSDSDIDIAVLFERGYTLEGMKLIEFRESLGEALKKEVDLVCLNTSSPILGMQVHKNGKPLFVNNSTAYDNYLVTLFTDYADLKKVRKPLEDRILERKFYDRP